MRDSTLLILAGLAGFYVFFMNPSIGNNLLSYIMPPADGTISSDGSKVWNANLKQWLVIGTQ